MKAQICGIQFSICTLAGIDIWIVSAIYYIDDGSLSVVFGQKSGFQ